MNVPNINNKYTRSLAIGMLIGIVFIAAIQTAGLRVNVGDSMHPTIQTPAISTTHPVDNVSEIEEGDIVVYKDALAVAGHTSHRVIEITNGTPAGENTNTTYVTTAPDNPAYSEQKAYVPADNVVAEVDGWVSINPLAYL